MRWEDERYVRLYTRDTTDWLMWPWQARAVFPLLLRKVDRAGLLPLGKHGIRGLAVVLSIPADIAEEGMRGLLADGCVIVNGEILVVRNYLEAQEAPSSDKQRAKDHRERAKAKALRDTVESSQIVTVPSQNVTPASRGVTARHAASHGVTPCLAVPIHTDPDRAADAARADEQLVAGFLQATDTDAALERQSTPTPAPSKPKRTKATNPRVGEVIALWCRLWADWKNGDRYQIAGKDAGQAKTLASWPAATDAEIERRFKRATLDPWFADKADLGLFVSQWNKHGGGAAPSEPKRTPAFDVRTCPDPYPDFDPDWTPPAPPKAVTHG